MSVPFDEYNDDITPDDEPQDFDRDNMDYDDTEEAASSLDNRFFAGVSRNGRAAVLYGSADQTSAEMSLHEICDSALIAHDRARAMNLQAFPDFAARETAAHMAPTYDGP